MYDFLNIFIAVTRFQTKTVGAKYLPHNKMKKKHNLCYDIMAYPVMSPVTFLHDIDNFQKLNNRPLTKKNSSFKKQTAIFVSFKHFQYYLNCFFTNTTKLYSTKAVQIALKVPTFHTHIPNITFAPLT